MQQKGRFCGLENYRIVLHNRAFLLAVKNTLRFLLVCLPLTICTKERRITSINGRREKTATPQNPGSKNDNPVHLLRLIQLHFLHNGGKRIFQ